MLGGWETNARCEDKVLFEVTLGWLVEGMEREGDGAYAFDGDGDVKFRFDFYFISRLLAGYSEVLRWLTYSRRPLLLLLRQMLPLLQPQLLLSSLRLEEGRS